MNENAAWQWKHLCFVLESAKGCREDESVVVALEFCAVVLSLEVEMLLSEAFIGYELLPVHG